MLKRLETGVKTNAYQSSVMTILNRSACVLIDGSAIRVSINYLLGKAFRKTILRSNSKF